MKSNKSNPRFSEPKQVKQNARLSVVNLPPIEFKKSHVHTESNNHKQIELQRQLINNIIEQTTDRQPVNKSRFIIKSQKNSVILTPQMRHYHSSIEEYNASVGKMFTASKFGAKYMQKKILHRLDPI